jgi:photosystem II stability/assembly factor-like uncharacterized protein
MNFAKPVSVKTLSLLLTAKTVRKNSHLWSVVTLVSMMVAGALLSSPVLGQQYDPDLYAGMRWRQIGPFRAGRVSAVAGIPGNPSVYYMGTPGGGVWKTVDGGMVWKPISDQIPVASIGAIAIAPSNSQIIYIGTGDVSNVGGSVNIGNGVYKSLDGGLNWQHIGLDDTEKIGAIWVDPKNPDTVVVAALGQTYARNEQRGLFKTTNGGKNWRKVLYKDDATGAIDVSFAPDNPLIGFAALWGHYVQPGNARGALDGSGGGGIYKTTDGGETWTPVTAGLPTERVGRIGVVVAPGGQRVYANVAGGRDGGLYTSDDGGKTWQKTTKDPRIQGSGYFGKVFLDPRNSDIVYIAQTSLYRSTDGGKNFISYKGAPGGDDNHALWIDPTNSDWMILGSDQGGVVSMDGGKSWSSWYNQPTGQIYHLSTDSRWPYWVYGTQQDSGSVGTLSRGDYGAITFLDWDAVGGYEFGYIVADPTDPNLVYAGGPGRGLVRIDRTNRQVATVSPNLSRDGDYRMAVNPPLAFSPQDPHILYEGTQFLLQTSDGGMRWKAISPDLTAMPASPTESPTPPAAATPAATATPPNRASINTFSPSPVKSGQIWVGTTNGLVQLTKDNGATWQQVSPAGLLRTSLVSIVEASHFEAAAAYAAIDNHENNDFRPHFYRTRDYGATWQEIVSGIPVAGNLARVIREDPVRKGLLYAGTESSTYVSFDDGDRWSPLQLNMPTVSVRDLVVHGNDLVAATYGRAFWILDDVTPLRQIDPKVSRSDVFLFEPGRAIRVRQNQNQDTPFPPEMPAGDNPPAGAVIDYYLKSAPGGDISLAIYDTSGRLVRQFSSKPAPPSTEPPPNVPDYWLARPKLLPKDAGMNRFVWDLRYTSPPALRHSYPISALYHNTPAEPQGPLVLPGKYEVRLTVNGHTYRQSLAVEMDPRVRAAPADLAQELNLAQTALSDATFSYDLYHQATELRAALAKREADVPSADSGNDGDTKALRTALKDLDQKVSRLAGDEARGGGGGGGGGGFGRPRATLGGLNGFFGDLGTIVDGADGAPTAPMRGAYHDYCKDLSTLLTQWSELVSHDVPAVNAELAKRNLAPLPAVSPAAANRRCE